MKKRDVMKERESSVIERRKITKTLLKNVEDPKRMCQMKKRDVEIENMLKNIDNLKKII